MRRPRPRPKLLHEKLLAIRKFLDLGQVDMANKLEVEICSHSGRQKEIQGGRISEYENGKREPNIFVLIAYVHLGQIHLESLVDDDLSTDEFRERLGEEFDMLRRHAKAKDKRNR